MVTICCNDDDTTIRSKIRERAQQSQNHISKMQRMNRSRKNLISIQNKLSATSSFSKRRKISSFWVVVVTVILGTIPVVFSLVWFWTLPPSSSSSSSSSSLKIHPLSRQSQTSSSSFTPINHDIMKNACDTTPHDNHHQRLLVRQDWKMIDSLLKSPQHQKEKVSGGIFLYPRQASLFYTLVSQLALHFQTSPRPLQICETGYGAGHSASLFFHAAAATTTKSQAGAAAEIHTFDKFDRPYQMEVWKLLQDKYSSSSTTTITTTTKNQTSSLFHYYKGDSCRTVPHYLSPSTSSTTPQIQCDFIHGSSLCGTDNIDLVEHSPCGVILTSTAMKSLHDNKVYFGKGGNNKKTHPPAQWRALRDRQCIRDIVCFEESVMELTTNFIFAAKGERLHHKFCMAITTGLCQKHPQNTNANTNNHKIGKDVVSTSTSLWWNNGTTTTTNDDTCNRHTDIYRAVQQFGTLKNFCPQYQIDIPE